MALGNWHVALGTWHSNSCGSSEGKKRPDKKKVRLAAKKSLARMGGLNGKKTQILIAYQKERMNRTKIVWLAAKKSSARD